MQLEVNSRTAQARLLGVIGQNRTKRARAGTTFHQHAIFPWSSIEEASALHMSAGGARVAVEAGKQGAGDCEPDGPHAPGEPSVLLNFSCC